MRETTLCYLEKDGSYLMLHRTKKKNDLNEGKWVGVGGKLEKDESPEEGALREIREETGLTAKRLKLRSVITFISDQWENEMMYLFTSDDIEGELRECEEGDLAWIPIEEVMSLPAWSGDKIFLEKIRDPKQGYFSLKLVYRGEELVQAVIWEDGIRKKIR